MIVALARSAYGSTEIVPARLSIVTPPATEPITLAEAAAQVKQDATGGEPSPAAAPILALGTPAVAGLLENGAHRLAVSYATADGETPPGPLSAPITVVDQTVNGTIAVTAIPAGGSAVTRIKFWMPPVGALAPLLYAGSVANGVTTATLNLADTSLGAQAPATNTTGDAELALWIAAARSLCEADPSADGSSGGTGRALITQTWTLLLDRFPNVWSGLATDRVWHDRALVGGGSGLRPIVVPKPPLVRVVSISYVDPDGVVQIWDPSLYSVHAPSGDYAEPGSIAPVYGHPFPLTRVQPGAVTIQFVAGYGAAAAVPAPLKAGMKLLIGNWWVNREAGQIIRGSADILPFGVDPLWQAFRVL